jgi:GxxExxY protein
MPFSKLEIKQLTHEVIGAAIEVHKVLGPGVLESVYEICLIEELKLRHIEAKRQVEVPIMYKGIEIEKALRLDVLVEEVLVLELKTVDSLLPIHEAQLFSYMRLLEKPKGLLLNFKSLNLTKSMKSFVNEHFDRLE